MRKNGLDFYVIRSEFKLVIGQRNGQAANFTIIPIADWRAHSRLDQPIEFFDFFSHLSHVDSRRRQIDKSRLAQHTQAINVYPRTIRYVKDYKRLRLRSIVFAAKSARGCIRPINQTHEKFISDSLFFIHFHIDIYIL